MNIIETLALITIIVGVLKLISMAIAPKETIEKGKKITQKTGLVQTICLILAAIVLYYLYMAGISILNILAIMLFANLVVGIALAPYAKAIYSAIKPKTLLRDNWLIFIISIALIVWGLKELFF